MSSNESATLLITCACMYMYTSEVDCVPQFLERLITAPLQRLKRQRKYVDPPFCTQGEI